MSPSNHAFSAISFITFILVLIPLPWHLEAWNTGTVIYMVWTSLATLNYFINSVVWDGSVVNYAPVWCDISTKFAVGAAFGIPCAALCISRRLYCIASAQTVQPSPKDKVRATAVDLSIGVGIPIIMMALHYVVQGHRFDIYEDVGCFPATYNVTLAYPLIQGPMLLIPAISGVYACMSIAILRRRQTAFKEMLASSSASITSSRYWRLMALASLEVLIGLPLTLTVILINTTLFPVQPWISWEDTHFGFSAVNRYPATIWRSNHLGATMLELTRSLPLLCGLIFFLFFGFAEEARKKYGAAMDRVCRLIGLSNPFRNPTEVGSSFGTGNGSSAFAKFKITTPGTGGNGSNAALPIYVQKEIINKRDSLDTVSDFMSILSESDSPKIYPIGLTEPSQNKSAAQSRSPSPTSTRLRREGTRAPESSFPASVTPEVSSFLEMTTPVGKGVLAGVAIRLPNYTRADNRV